MADLAINRVITQGLTGMDETCLNSERPVGDNEHVPLHHSKTKEEEAILRGNVCVFLYVSDPLPYTTDTQMLKAIKFINSHMRTVMQGVLA